MGCDIHVIVERRWRGRWVGVVRNPMGATGRDYDRFAALAGVRGEGPPPRGWPDDASDFALIEGEKWESELHHRSWLPMGEALKAWGAGDSPHDADRVFDIWPHGLHWVDDYRVLFGFDN